jgi:hypothetical protein
LVGGGSAVSKVDWMPLVDQIDGWDFVHLSRTDSDIPIKQSVIPICISIACPISFWWVYCSMISLDIPDHFLDAL